MSILILSPASGIVVALAAIGMLELVRKQIGVRRDYESIYSLGVAFAAFAAGEAVHGSGFLAAFAAVPSVGLAQDTPPAAEKAVTVPFELLPDTELIESICENEKDSEHISGK